MNSTTTLDDENVTVVDKPGLVLAEHRMELNYTTEFVAEKLHLRVRVIEMLEDDDYHNMPEPVFVKGYLRAYAKLLGVPHEPLLSSFNKLHGSEKKLEKALWQSKRENNRAERVIRWVTASFAVVVIAAVGMWWFANKENEHIFSANFQSQKPSDNPRENEIRLTDLSKMRSLLSSSSVDLKQG